MTKESSSIASNKEIIRVHRSSVGLYHPDPKAEIAWSINDTRGYIDHGPACDECGACEDECQICYAEGAKAHTCIEDNPEMHADMSLDDAETYGECAGLSFAFICLDGGESLCEACADNLGAEIVPCDCP